MPIVINKSKINVPLQRYYQNWKFVYVDSNGAEQTIGGTEESDNNRVINASCVLRSLRYGISDCRMILFNNDAHFNKILNKATVVKCYAEHTNPSSAPTNQVFLGRITSKKYSLDSENNRYLSIYGLNAPQLARRHITINFRNGAAANSALQSVIDTFFSGVFTYNNISPSMTGTIYGDYINQLAIDVVSDILKQVGFDGYIDFDGDIHTWAEGTNINANESIIYGDNMLPYDEVGYDYIDICILVRTS